MRNTRQRHPAFLTPLGLLGAFLMCLAASPALGTVHFVEAESFQVTGDGWQSDLYTQSQEGVTRQQQASRARALWGGAGAGDSTASATVTAPAAGDYRLHVRYLQGPSRGPFRVAVFQDGQEVAGKDFDLEENKDVPVGNYRWDSLAVRLAAGDTVIRLSKYRDQPGPEDARYVDCVLLTDDQGLQPDYRPYSPQVYARITLGDGYEQPLYIYTLCCHYSGPTIYAHYSFSKDGFHNVLEPSAGAFYRNNETTGWVNITKELHPDYGALLLMSARYNYAAPAARFRATIDFATEPDDAKIVRTLQVDASPPNLYVIVPPDLSAANLPNLKTAGEIADATGQIADAMQWPTFGKPPALFPYLTYADPEGQRAFPVDKKVADREWKTLDYFGFANRHKEHIGGCWTFKNGCFFQPDTETMEPIIRNAAAAFHKSGKTLANIANCMLTDEVGGQRFSHVAHCPTCAEQFRLWMKELGNTPADLGVASWDDVRPVDETHGESEPALYYYSQRFRMRGLTKMMATQRELVFQAYGGTFPVDVNSCDGPTHFANLVHQGSVDYFELLEHDDQQNATWSESWAVLMPCNPYNVELQRSAAMKRGQTVGHSLIAYAGRLPWDIKLMTVSMLARDVKVMADYYYGPSWVGPEGGPPWRCSAWYAKPETWLAHAELAREIGGAEDLLYPAKKKKAEAAILYSCATDIWALNRTWAYGFDRMLTWLALTHAHIPVDFISEQRVAEQGLRGYKVCYYAGRNLTRAAAAQLAAWVKRGGTLVLTAGAGARDEYNQPMTALDGIRPAAYGPLDEFQQYQAGGQALHSHLQPKENVTMPADGTQLEVLSVKQELRPNRGAQVLGTFADGSPAVVMKPIRRGRVYSFGFLPGLAYLRPALAARQQLADSLRDRQSTGTPDRSRTLSDAELLRRSACPWQYPAAIKNVIVAPALQAGADRPVLCNVPLVDAVCMETDAGLVVPLANYSLQPVEAVTLAVATKKRIRRVESIHHGNLEFNQAAGRATFSLPLLETDFVKLYY